MPGTAYHSIANQCTDWLSVVEECQIQSNTKLICDSLKTVELGDDEEIISFDVSSLYTNVPVIEAIEHCADLLYSGKYELPPVDKETFITLLKLGTCDVVMLTHDGYYRQTDGLAMGSPPAPLLANGWLSKFDPLIKGDATIYFRYMDDIVRNIRRTRIDGKLAEINLLHENLKFTIEKEIDGKLPFLDMLLMRNGKTLSSTWYNKPTDTGLIMNYHALAPKRYKRSVVAGFVHRIYRACSSWALFHESLEKAKKILERNQYPPPYYNSIIHDTIYKIVEPSTTETETSNVEEKPTDKDGEETEVPKKMIFIQYRGKVTEDYCRALKKSEAPVNPIQTLRKLRTVLPSLKKSVEHKVRSGVVYKFDCPRCKSCYVGWTEDHICTRWMDHKKPSRAVGKHLRNCGVLEQVSCEDMKVLASTTRGEQYGMTLEAIWQQKYLPTINTKEEYKSRTLTIVL